ncbi:trimethylamine--corrinoid protein Co-methyltransferase [Peptococcaceae bacterium DYL19]|nr:trimethylamine--corrinoid protein Co-methyltransferase [Phosphitispora fastidiosa]
MLRDLKANSSHWLGLGMQSMAPAQLDEIHNATLKVLQFTGIKVYCPEALQTLAEGGADVDFVSGRVRIPAYLVEDAIASAPSYVILAARDPQHDVYVGGKRVHFTTFGSGCRVVDYITDDVHESTKTDVEMTALVCDALDNVDIYVSTLKATDMPIETTGLHEAEAFLLNTVKHCQHTNLGSGHEAVNFFKMAAAITGGTEELRRRPIVSAMVCPSSPLQLHKATSEIIMESARAGIPVNILSMVMAGATAPVTLAGTLVVHNAEVLGGIVLHQLTNKGAPVIYGSSSTIFDMKSLTAPVGAPEMAMLSAACAELANFYLLPSFVGGT